MKKSKYSKKQVTESPNWWLYTIFVFNLILCAFINYMGYLKFSHNIDQIKDETEEAVFSHICNAISLARIYGCTPSGILESLPDDLREASYLFGRFIVAGPECEQYRALYQLWCIERDRLKEKSGAVDPFHFQNIIMEEKEFTQQDPSFVINIPLGAHPTEYKNNIQFEGKQSNKDKEWNLINNF